MPTSNLALAPAILGMVAEVRHEAVLDVGPGWGKYGVLLREYVGGVTRLDAVEMWEPYVAAHRLEGIYDEVIAGDALELSRERLAAYDVVLMVDVIEHVEKDAGLAFLERVTGTTIICTPESFFQNPEADEIPPEKHRSLWTTDEFTALGATVCSVALGGILVRL